MKEKKNKDSFFVETKLDTFSRDERRMDCEPHVVKHTTNCSLSEIKLFDKRQQLEDVTNDL